MKATVKFFAALREMIGARELSLEVADGQTVDGLFRELCARFPRLADYESQDGDEVAFIPPVSGGRGAD